MSYSNHSDHWDLLASTLGAEPQKREPIEPKPQAEEKSSEVVENTDAQVSSTQAPCEPDTVRPARRLSNWDALAMDLGLEVKPEPPPPRVPTKLSAPKQAEVKEVIHAKQSHKYNTPVIAEEHREQFEPFEIPEALSDNESEEPRDKKSRHRRRRRRKDGDQDRTIDETKKTVSDSGRKTLETDELLVAKDSIESAGRSGGEEEEDSVDGKGDKHRQKHRRSHRGSRNRKKKGDESVSEKSADMKKGESFGQIKSVEASEISTASAGEEDMAEEEREEGGQRGDKTSFRAIPTWSETVGIIVEKNMESRPKRHGTGPSRSRSSESHKKRSR